MIKGNTDTIVALATPGTESAISVIRISGNQSLEIIKKSFKPAKINRFERIKPYCMYYGSILEQNSVIDQVILSYFKAPASYTGEDMIEISCHGSVFIQQKIIEIINFNGARIADPGEFTKRAFLNGKMDLSQAEAVADLISSSNKASHDIALKQVKDGYGKEISNLRARLLKLVSLMELELDFSEEDVEFADRKELSDLLSEVIDKIKSLIESFRYGNVIKNGMPVVIAGKPNVGKSTLLNALLKEDRAIVSDIPGTTRDSLEDEMIIDGYRFRFIDTAGLRDTGDEIEMKGIQKSWEKLKKAGIILFMMEASDTPETTTNMLSKVESELGDFESDIFLVINKIDEKKPESVNVNYPVFNISAKIGTGINELISGMLEKLNSIKTSDNIIISNARHAESLRNALESASRAEEALFNQIPGDLVSQDIREVLHHLGDITGEITTDEVLGSIFKDFCIGK